MKELKEAIENKGIFLSDDILKVDTFLNHQIDIELMDLMGQAFADHFKDKGITKVVTVETGGIAPGYAAARALGVPLIFTKKTEPNTMLDPVYSEVFSYTKKKHYTICMEKDYLHKEDKVLFIDDFLANGEAFKGIEELMEQTGASIAGVGICIEKAFQKGHAYITSRGYDLYSLAPIATVKDRKITWADE